MERGTVMLLHSAIIAALMYLCMVYILNQKHNIAENRSLLVAAFALIYMILFGHGLPTNINKYL